MAVQVAKRLASAWVPARDILAELWRWPPKSAAVDFSSMREPCRWPTSKPPGTTPMPTTESSSRHSFSAGPPLRGHELSGRHRVSAPCGMLRPYAAISSGKPPTTHPSRAHAASCLRVCATSGYQNGAFRYLRVDQLGSRSPDTLVGFALTRTLSGSVKPSPGTLEASQLPGALSEFIRSNNRSWAGAGRYRTRPSADQALGRDGSNPFSCNAFGQSWRRSIAMFTSSAVGCARVRAAWTL